MAMKINGYTYDYTTVNTGIPGVQNDRVNEELTGISMQASTQGRQTYRGSTRKASGINDGTYDLSGTLEMSLELYEEIVKSEAFADGIDMAAPFNMSITVKASVAPYTSIEFVWEGVRLERPNMDWKKGSSDLPVQVPYKCLERTMDGIPC